MPINFESLKKRLENEKNKKSNYEKQPNLPIWKPVEGEYIIRIMPFNLEEEVDSVYKKYEVMYLKGESKTGKRYKKQVYFPEDFVDPFKEHRSALYATKKKEDKEAAKELTPRLVGYCLIKVQESEIEGKTVKIPENKQEPQFFKLSQSLIEQIDGLFSDLVKKLSKKKKIEDINIDFTDVNDGLNLQVKVRFKTKIDGFDVFDYSISFEDYTDRCPAFEEDGLLDVFYKKVPDIDAYHCNLGHGTQEDYDMHLKLLCKTLDNQTEQLKEQKKKYEEQPKSSSKQVVTKQIENNLDTAFEDDDNLSNELDDALKDLLK
jgi:hypothetical protein